MNDEEKRGIALEVTKLLVDSFSEARKQGRDLELMISDLSALVEDELRKMIEPQVYKHNPPKGGIRYAKIEGCCLRITAGNFAIAEVVNECAANEIMAGLELVRYVRAHWRKADIDEITMIVSKAGRGEYTRGAK